MNTDEHGCKKVEGRDSEDEGALTPSLSHPMGEGGRRPGEGSFNPCSSVVEMNGYD